MSEEAVTSAVPSEAVSYDKIDKFQLRIEGGLLDNLGIKMYTKLGKVLVEFAANAYDSDSPSVDFEFDLAAIAESRVVVRAAAKQRLAQAPTTGVKRKAQVVVDPLPEEIKVVIKDTGHGMTPTEIARKFLPINRNRRVDDNGSERTFTSEAGKRLVMGRKGIGKLSAFGAAAIVTVRTKRTGQPFWTVITMASQLLLKSSDIGGDVLPHRYEDLPADASEEDLGSHGTTIELSGLRCDAVNFTAEDIEEILGETFYPIKPAEFEIRLNGRALARPQPELEFWWPDDIKLDGYKTETLRDDDWGEIDFRYRVQFRRKSLIAGKRGAYIYAKDRLASEPSLLKVDTGTHNFMAHQYMECIVLSDDLDNLNIDVIGTNRAGIIENSDLVKAFLARVTSIMTEAIKAHAAFREMVADKVIDESPRAKAVREILAVIPAGQRRAARQLVRIFLARYGADSDEFEQVTPLIMGTINAGQVLVDLVRVSTHPSSLKEITEKLVQLREIERSDALKAFQARRNGIVALRNLKVEGEDNWARGPQNEKQLHSLLKEAPWLIRPELSDYVASDVTIGEVLDRLAVDLAIDKYAPKPVPVDLNAIKDPNARDDAEAKATLRPDLVALIGDAIHPNRILVIELKSTATPLRTEHLTQLKRYMRRISEHFATEHVGGEHQVIVEGVLIGAMPASTTTSDPQRDLLSECAKRGPTESWQVIGLNELLRRTEMVHRELISALRKDEEAGTALSGSGIPLLAAD